MVRNVNVNVNGEEEDKGRGKWEDVRTAIEFSAGNNGDGGCGGPVEGRES